MEMKKAGRARLEALKGRAKGPDLAIAIGVPPGGNGKSPAQDAPPEESPDASTEDAGGAGGDGGSDLSSIIDTLKQNQGDCPPEDADKYAQAVKLLEECDKDEEAAETPEEEQSEEPSGEEGAAAQG